MVCELVEEHRARLRAVAYRMLGLLSEPGGAVQEAWLRVNRTHASAVENPGGRLTAVVGRTAAMPLPWGRCA
jgi:DNA-directed RNA polymerase specialized sigma24 family protein